MDIMVGLLQILAKMAVMVAAALGGVFVGHSLRKRKKLKQEKAAMEQSSTEEEA